MPQHFDLVMPARTSSRRTLAMAATLIFLRTDAVGNVLAPDIDSPDVLFGAELAGARDRGWRAIADRVHPARIAS
jgi:hypothetical protein